MSEGHRPTRFSAFLYIVVGIACGLWQWQSLVSNGRFRSLAVMAAVLMTPMGIVGLIEPKLINPWHSQYLATPSMSVYQGITAVLLACFGALAFYLAQALQYGWWLPLFLVEAIARR